MNAFIEASDEEHVCISILLSLCLSLCLSVHTLFLLLSQYSVCFSLSCVTFSSSLCLAGSLSMNSAVLLLSHLFLLLSSNLPWLFFLSFSVPFPFLPRLSLLVFLSPSIALVSFYYVFFFRG